MKQALKTLLAALLVLTMLFTAAACGGDKKPDDKDATGTTDANNDFFTDTEVVTSNDEGTTGNSGGAIPDANKVAGKSWKEVLASMPKKLKGTTVEVYNWNPASEYTGAPAVIEKFQKETGIKVKWTRVNHGEYWTKLDGLIANKQAPDAVRTDTPLATRMTQFQSLDAAKYDFSDAAWDPIVMKAHTINGVTLATSLKNTHIGIVEVMHYNKNLIEKYDLEDPYQLWKAGKWDTNKLIEIARQYAKASGNKIAVTGIWNYDWLQMRGIDGNIAYKNGQYVNMMSDPTFLKVTQEYADLSVTEGLFGGGRAEIMDAGNALFYAGGSIYTRKKNTYMGTLKSEGSLYIVPMPAVTGQSTYYQARHEFEAYAIAKAAKNPEAVPYFLRYFLDGANYDLNSFFCNKQNLEVYNWCMQQENIMWTIGFVEPKSDTDGIGRKTANQVKPYVDSISPYVDSEVRKLNDALKKVGK